MRPRRSRTHHWKWLICFARGHDWGMFYNREEMGYDDICVRCGHRKKP